MTIETRVESKRGCGYRQPGGTYLMSGINFQSCGKVPIELSVCPVCSQGVKPARGFTWIQPGPLAEGYVCSLVQYRQCGECPFGDSPPERMGLIWIGEKFYKSSEVFQEEARLMGISRRITAVPHGFKLGEDWIALAHKYIPQGHPSPGDEQEYIPGIFMVFKPTAIEYVVKGTETEKELDAMEKRGLTLVEVRRKSTQQELGSSHGFAGS